MGLGRPGDFPCTSNAYCRTFFKPRSFCMPLEPTRPVCAEFIDNECSLDSHCGPGARCIGAKELERGHCYLYY
ncbi:unnamed protein product, partial [Mesorhabditis spiculigera]